MLQLEGITFSYGGRQGHDHNAPALRDVTLTMGPGLTVLLGPNGSGKSTLLKVACGLLRPQSGTVSLDGRPLASYRPASRARLIVYLPQLSLLPEGLTVLETVLLGRLPHLGMLGSEGPADLAAARRALAQTGLEPLASRPVESLSGGERQRVALARALCTGAPHLLLDEPAGHLDLHHVAVLLRLLRTLADDGASTILMVAHDPNLAAAADRVVLLAQGRVVAAGAPGALVGGDAAVLRQVYGDGFSVLRVNGRWAVLPAVEAQA